jgi:tRNA nucleotidyltransferase (CCA-adding enzyme)
MEQNAYVKSIVTKYALMERSTSATAAAIEVNKIIQRWGGSWLLEVQYSGSSAKGTAISGITDIDLFISLKPETPETLAEIYDSLANYSGLSHLSPRRQNVSVGIKYGTHSIDLVPGRKQSGNTTDHSLYRSKAKTWTQTNVNKHISLIQNSQRLDEIRALKIWRAQHGVDFPSFYLELTVINALYGKKSVELAANVRTVLEYLRDIFVTAVVVDPVNSNNTLSDDLTVAEKKLIAQKASTCLKEPNWNQIIW